MEAIYNNINTTNAEMHKTVDIAYRVDGIGEAVPKSTVEAVVDTFHYKLRELEATDLGAVCKLINAIGIKEFRSCFENEDIKNVINRMAEDGTDMEQIMESVGIGVMFDVASIITTNYVKAEKEIQAFIGSVTGLTIEEVGKIKLADYGELIVRIVMMKDFKDFFLRAFKLFR